MRRFIVCSLSITKMLLLLPMLLILIAHGAWSIKKMEELVVDISTNLISNGNVKGRTTENFEITCNILGEKENYTMKFIWTKQDNFKLKLVYHVSSRDIILIDRTLGIRQLFNGREEFSECFDPKEVGYAPGCQNCNMLCMRLHKMSKVYTVGHVPTVKFNAKIEHVVCATRFWKNGIDKCWHTNLMFAFCDAAKGQVIFMHSPLYS